MKKEEKVYCPIVKFISDLRDCCRDKAKELLGEEFLKHSYAAAEELLLALRSLIDKQIEKLKRTTPTREEKVEEVEIKSD